MARDILSLPGIIIMVSFLSFIDPSRDRFASEPNSRNDSNMLHKMPVDATAARQAKQYKENDNRSCGRTIIIIYHVGRWSEQRNSAPRWKDPFCLRINLTTPSPRRTQH